MPFTARCSKAMCFWRSDPMPSTADALDRFAWHYRYAHPTPDLEPPHAFVEIQEDA